MSVCRKGKVNKVQFKQNYKKITPRSIALGILLLPLFIILAPLAIVFDYWVRGIQAEYYGGHDER